MAKTPLTNASSLLSALEFLKRVDRGLVGDLCADVDDAGQVVRIDSKSLLTNPNLLAALDDATGELEGACMKAGRYLPEDLAALTGTAKARRDRLLATLTLGFLIERRPKLGIPLPEYHKLALETLEALRTGEMIFGLAEVVEAGVIDADEQTADEVEEQNLTTYQARRLFGRRGNRDRSWPR